VPTLYVVLWQGIVWPLSREIVSIALVVFAGLCVNGLCLVHLSGLAKTTTCPTGKAAWPVPSIAGPAG